MISKSILLLLRSGAATRELLYESLPPAIRLVEESEWDGPVTAPIESAELYAGPGTGNLLLAISGADYLRLQAEPGGIEDLVLAAATAETPIDPARLLAGFII